MQERNLRDNGYSEEEEEKKKKNAPYLKTCETQ